MPLTHITRALLVSVLVIMATLVGAAGADDTTCSSCSDCSTKLSGSYNKVTLSKDITVSSGDCISFNTDDVTLDCEGHSITGNNSGVGISDIGYDGVIVKGCQVKNFSIGIHLRTLKNASLNGNTVKGCTSHGIVIENVDECHLDNNVVGFNTQGVVISDSANVSVSYNKMCANIEYDIRSTQPTGPMQGIKNTCDVVYPWADAGVSSGCTFKCDWCKDWDMDGICDAKDNCIFITNASQKDSDGDKIGDPCDSCPNAYDPVQKNSDVFSGVGFDSKGDACDNCWMLPNESQKDSDGDCAKVKSVAGYWDAAKKKWLKNPKCGDTCDNCDNVSNPDQSDKDNDEVGDACDNCASVYNPEQYDKDNDDVGDACEDTDGDGKNDKFDNCWNKSNPDQKDMDNDNVGDICDNCPFIYQHSQEEVLVLVAKGGLAQYEGSMKGKVFRRGQDLPTFKAIPLYYSNMPYDAKVIAQVFIKGETTPLEEITLKKYGNPFKGNLSYMGSWDWSNAKGLKKGDLPVGEYQVRVKVDTSTKKNTCLSGLKPFHVIFDTPTDLDKSSVKAYLYDTGDTRDENGIFYPGFYSINGPSYGEEVNYVLDPFDENLFGLVDTAIEGAKTHKDGADKLMKMLCGIYYYSKPSNPMNTAKLISAAKVTKDQVKKIINDTSQYNLISAHCHDYANAMAAVLRSAGIPARPATGVRSGNWNYHAWTEAYIEKPPAGGDHWYMYDANLSNKETRKKWSWGKTSIEVPVGDTTWAADYGKLEYVAAPVKQLKYANWQAKDAMFEKCKNKKYDTSGCNVDPPIPEENINITFEKKTYRVGEEVVATVSVRNPESDSAVMEVEFGVEKVPRFAREEIDHTPEPFFSQVESMVVPAMETVSFQTMFAVSDTIYPYYIFRAYVSVREESRVPVHWKGIEVMPAFDATATVPETISGEGIPVTLVLENFMDFDVNEIDIKLELPPHYEADRELVMALPVLHPGERHAFSWTAVPREKILKLKPVRHFRIVVTSADGGSAEIEIPHRVKRPPVLLVESYIVEEGQTTEDRTRRGPVEIRISNIGDMDALDVKIGLALPEGVSATEDLWVVPLLPPGETYSREVEISHELLDDFDIVVFAVDRDGREASGIVRVDVNEKERRR